METRRHSDMRGRPAPVRRIVLVGFMGAGKSTIAPRLAHALGWRVFDVDLELTREAGRTIAEIFRDDGEPHFRRIEAELTARLCSDENVIVAAGGGWITTPGSAVVRSDPATRLVWLRVSPATAVARAREDSTERPLLSRENALENALDVATRLLAEREPLYASADLAIDTDGRTADDVVDDILTWLKTSI